MAKISKKILLVEDEAEFLAILKNAFEGAGFLTCNAKDGEEALVMVDQENPDLIVLDILLPKTDGIKVAEKLKKAGRRIPIIFLTNVKDENSVSNSLLASGGDSDYIVKTDTHIADVIKRAKSRLGVK